MTELDFEELDKAVNSLMSGVDTTKRSVVADDPEDKVVTLDDPTPVASPTSDEISTSTSSPVGQPNPSLAVKRRGQFMDVMHPSSDMKSTTVAAPAHRQGITITPANSSLKAESTPPGEQSAISIDDPVTNENRQSELVETKPVLKVDDNAKDEVDTTSMEAVKNEWPDPIDVASMSQSSGSITPEISAKVDQSYNEQVSTEATTNDTEPLSSPFLPDAKVEKRPLGALSDTADTSFLDRSNPDKADTVSQDSVADVVDADLQSPPPVQLPDELKSEVIALESSNTKEETLEAGVGTENDISHGQTPQQYSEQPPTEDRPSTPIYDTSTHAQPLEKPRKKSSAWKWVIWFLALVILSILGGAAYFYFTT